MGSNPTPGDRHIQAALTNLSVAYMQNSSAFIADQAFSIVPVNKMIDKYYTYNRSDAFRNNMRKRAPKTISEALVKRLSNDAYECANWALHAEITDIERGEADPIFGDLEKEATEDLTVQDMLNRDIEFAENYFAASKWGSVDVTPNNLWDTASGVPIANTNVEIAQMAKDTGKIANTYIMSPEVFFAVIENPEITEKIKYTSSASVTQEMLANILFPKGGRILVPWGVQTTSNPGQADQTTDFIYGKHALLLYVDPKPGKKVLSAGYTFVNRGIKGVGATGTRISKYRMNEFSADFVEIDSYWDQKQVAPLCGQLMKDVIS